MPIRSLSAIAAGATFAAIVVACTSGSKATSNPDAPSLSASCIAAADHSDLTWIQANIFDHQCEFSGCHGSDSGGTTGRQDLEAGSAIPSLVNQPSNLETDRTLVIPGDSADSYMMVMLGSVPGPIPATDAGSDALGTMPLDTNGELLCQTKRDAIARWIDMGAQNN